MHNFPEGFATFIAAIQNPEIGVAVAVAIAIHNIPEGLAVAVPVYQATGSRRKALRWATVSGLAEPAGAIVGYLLLMPFISDGLFGVVFAAIAGVMVFISLDELLPTAEEYGEHHWAIYGLVAGMAVMGISLVLL
ncbi:ZIP family metal transporter [Gulosibacter sp. GYB002]|uniref:ZIP family metal transporter n=1 Tax=Gulosibacter sp. GYB002 TaxID=2994391 RepID=UPI002F96E4DC